MLMIDTYPRWQALEDGVLVDVAAVAKEAGFKFPVAITQGLHAELNNIPEEHNYQDYSGRLWDVLSMAVFAIRASQDKGSSLKYTIICHHEKFDNKGRRRIEEKLELQMLIHPGDKMEPVITIGTSRCDM
mgnify:CR=1 FL=1|jgi:hypothetical protein